jgi:hypothetical protein
MTTPANCDDRRRPQIEQSTVHTAQPYHTAIANFEQSVGRLEMAAAESLLKVPELNAAMLDAKIDTVTRQVCKDAS